MVEKKKHPGGRPRKPVDYDMVESLGLIHCTEAEVAVCLDMDQAQVSRRLQDDKEFCIRYKKGITEGKRSLRRKQYDVAMSGDRTLLIWLGKQLLGQTDKERHEITGLGGKPVEFIEVVRPGEASQEGVE